MRFGALLALALLLPAFAEDASPKWKRGAPLPLARGEVAAAVAEGRIYIIGGFTANGQGSTRAEAYSPATGTWSTEADLPVPVHHPMAAGYRGRVYVAGGYGPDHAQLATLFAFTGDGWTRLASMPEDRAAGGAAIVNGKLYVVGGTTSSPAGRLARTMLVYDIAANRWTTRRGPTPREHLGVATLGGRIYVVGGRTAGFDTNMALVEAFNPRTGRWTRLPKVPGRRGGTGAAGTGRSIVSVGGEAPAGTIRTVYRYDVRRRRWSRLPNLPTPRHGLGVAAVGRKVYVIGGGTSPGLSVSQANESLVVR
jgi:N-acetylneuraminic acid mutarotase